MSSNLTAEPVTRKKLDLGTSLKFILRKKLGEPIHAEVNADIIPFLEGISYSADNEAAKDARILIEFIEKHINVYLKEEY